LAYLFSMGGVAIGICKCCSLLDELRF
jgi:hypothetical protein